MNNRTAYQAQQDLYQLVKGSDLASFVNGQVYHAGSRPRDSKAEDIVIGYVAGMPGEIQTLVFNVNVFVPDLDPWPNGVLTPDVARLTAIEEQAAAWVKTLNVATTDGKYKVSQYDNIHSSEAREIGQHFVNIALRLEHWANYD